jgi:hypothetical protein
VTTTIPQLPHAVVDVRPGDQDAATTVEAWLQDYATSRDPQLRERIILAYLGVADRLARRFRDSRGTSAEDLVQTARAGLIAAIDRYNPGYSTPFVPYAVACVVGELKRHLRDTSWRLHIARPLNDPCGCAGQPMSCISAWSLTYHRRAGRAAGHGRRGGPGRVGGRGQPP